jgi:tRNA (guanine37-N1)-methyltransferase
VTAAVTVRPATAADVPEIAALAALTFPLACPPSSTAADQAAFIAAHLSPAHVAGWVAAADHSVLVAQDAAGALVGYTLVIHQADGPPEPEMAAIVPLRPVAYLSKCYVHPAAQGQGVAGTLMTATLDAARAAGAAGSWLGVNGENLRAQAFYRRSGFAVVGERTFRVGERTEHDLVLHRAL